MNPSLPLIVIIGPTGVGKTKVSIEVAERVDGEIVSADSRLLYRGMDIGTDKPSAADRARVPHHMIDVTDPEHPWSLADYQSAALKTINAIHQRGKRPLLVGGTGQYVTAILEGWSPPVRTMDRVLRQRFEEIAKKQGAQFLHGQLEDIDLESAKRIDYRNVRRVIRALEIYHVTGTPASQQRIADPPHYNILRIGLTLPRTELYKRIDARIETMINAGFVEEVQRLLDHDLDPNLPAMTAIGYRQIADHIRGSLSIEDAIVEIRRATRQFVRRQANWFKIDDPQIHWFEARENIVDQVVALIRQWLAQDGSPDGG